jgi:hypothetical protein
LLAWVIEVDESGSTTGQAFGTSEQSLVREDGKRADFLDDVREPLVGVIHVEQDVGMPRSGGAEDSNQGIDPVGGEDSNELGRRWTERQDSSPRGSGSRREFSIAQGHRAVRIRDLSRMGGDNRLEPIEDRHFCSQNL